MALSFEESLRTGIHHRLHALCGSWTGTARTWFEPDVLADESLIHGSIQAILNGRFLLHEYAAELGGEPLQGAAIYGYNLQLARFEAAWIDSWHNGTGIMFSAASAPAQLFSALGQYADPSGGPPWGWRTTIDLPEPDQLIITYDNITPDGQAAKAVEIRYRRVPTP